MTIRRPGDGAAWRKRMRETRIARGMDQKALAQQMGRSQSAVNNWELGYNSPGVNEIETLAAILGVPPEWLFFGIEPVVSDANLRRMVLDSIDALRRALDPESVVIEGIEESEEWQRGSASGPPKQRQRAAAAAT